ncbi:hypothetical protein GCM10010129_06370 [Streptomyces fumigatiscleroticus]|nr:hypothetical protein GCM10010129_06370 [Streptomyces fumigatiscleroticus]
MMNSESADSGDTAGSESAGTSPRPAAAGNREPSTGLLRGTPGAPRPLAPAAPSWPARRLLRMSERGAALAPGKDGVNYMGYEPDTALVLSAASAWAYSDADTLHTMLETACGMDDVKGETFSVRKERSSSTPRRSSCRARCAGRRAGVPGTGSASWCSAAPSSGV